MRGNSFGKLLSITSFGESHGESIGVIVDGVPSNLAFSLEDLQEELNRRAPGQSKGTTPRKEADIALVQSGIFENKTLGTPICIIIKNTNQRSEDYKKLENEYRPGHADQTTMLKYGIRDHRGGGRSSGRETIARVIGGYFSKLILPKEVLVRGFVSKIENFIYNDIPQDLSKPFSPYGFPIESENINLEKFLIDLKKEGDSVGGEIKLIVRNCPVGLGEPAFDKLKADLAKAVMSIGAVVGFSFGIGSEFSKIRGKELDKYENAFGGIEGGISNGKDIILTVTFKPTSTVGEKAKEGRHDPCIIPRAIPVVEAMVSLVLADHYLRQKAYS